jgi:hypothetical protein
LWSLLRPISVNFGDGWTPFGHQKKSAKCATSFTSKIFEKNLKIIIRFIFLEKQFLVQISLSGRCSPIEKKIRNKSLLGRCSSIEHSKQFGVQKVSRNRHWIF